MESLPILISIVVTILALLSLGSCVYAGYKWGFKSGKKAGFQEAKDALLSTKNAEVWETAHFLHIDQTQKEEEAKKLDGATTRVMKTRQG